MNGLILLKWWVNKSLPVAAVILLVSLSSCEDSNYLDSRKIEQADERVQVLSKEVNFHSEVTDAEFDLFNVNGFHNDRMTVDVPGASCWEYCYLIRTDEASLDNWSQGLEASSYDIKWVEELVSNRPDNWITTDARTCLRIRLDIRA